MTHAKRVADWRNRTQLQAQAVASAVTRGDMPAATSAYEQLGADMAEWARLRGTDPETRYQF